MISFFGFFCSSYCLSFSCLYSPVTRHYLTRQTNIGFDNSFCEENAQYLKKISILAACDCAYFFVMLVIGIVMNAVHPGILFIALFAIFAGIVIAVATAALSHLVYKAAALQDQSDLTI